MATRLRLAAACQTRTANGRYRAVLPMLELQRSGHMVHWPGDPSFRVLENGGVPAWDLLHLQQFFDEETLAVMRRLREGGVAVVWDSDDHIGAVPRGNEAYQRLGGRRMIRKRAALVLEIARTAHLVTTTSEQLVTVYREAGVEHVQRIENYLGRDDLGVPRRRHQGIVIGLTAAGEHEDDLRKLQIGKALEGLLARHDGVRVVSIGVDLRLASHRYTHVRSVEIEELLHAEAEFDVGLAPLRDTPFNRARSTVKLKEYAAAGAMWLASPVGPYADMGAEQGGVLVREDEWPAALDAIVRDDARRRELAQNARAWAKSQTIAVARPAWEAAFRGAVLRARGDTSTAPTRRDGRRARRRTR